MLHRFPVAACTSARGEHSVKAAYKYKGQRGTCPDNETKQKGEALGGGDKLDRSSAAKQHSKSSHPGVLPSWLGTASRALQGSGSVQPFY